MRAYVASRLSVCSRDRFQLVAPQTQRLLDEDILIRGERRDHCRSMLVMTRRDRDGVDAGIASSCACRCCSREADRSAAIVR